MFFLNVFHPGFGFFHCSLFFDQIIFTKTFFLSSMSILKTLNHRLQPVLNSAACAHQTLKILSHYSYSKISPLAQDKWKNRPSYPCSLLSFPPHCPTPSLITHTRPSLTSFLKIANRSYYHSAPCSCFVEQSDLGHHVTPSLILNSSVSDLSTFLFLKKLKTFLFHCSFPP